MSVTVTCPECDDVYQVSDQAAEQLVRCRRCQCPIDVRRQEMGIQSRPASVSASRNRDEDDETEHARPPRHHPVPRSPFPATALLIIVIGVLFFLLAFSVGFNIWFLTREDKRFGMNNARLAEQQAARAAQQEMQLRAEMEVAQKELAIANGKPVEPNAKQVAVKQWGVLNGRVRLQGDPPPKRSLKDEIAKHKDGPLFLKAPEDELAEPLWTINADNQGVANVVVYLRSADGKPLAIPPQECKARPNVVLDVSSANFRPHIVVLTPKISDGLMAFETAQKLRVENNSKLSQCVKIVAAKNNSDIDVCIKQNSEREFAFRPEPRPLKVTNQLYGWMSARLWIFDHPYHAITDKNGEFEIPLAPRDVDLRLMIWHEALDFVDGKEGRPLRLNGEKTDLDLHIRAK